MCDLLYLAFSTSIRSDNGKLQAVPGPYRHELLYHLSHYFQEHRTDDVEDSSCKMFLCYLSYIFVLVLVCCSPTPSHCSTLPFLTHTLSDLLSCWNIVIMFNKHNNSIRVPIT